MWWYLVKELENETEIIYAYGKETQETSGRIRYDRAQDEFDCLALADGDDETTYVAVLPHLYTMIHREGAPETRQVSNMTF